MNQDRDTPLKAYLCTTDDPEETRVIFAKSNGAAKFPYAREVDHDPASVTVRRAPHHDVHAPGPVPVSALLEDGWYFECSCCLRRISYNEDFVEALTPEGLRAHAERQAPYIAELARFDAEFPKPDEPSEDLPHPVKWRMRQDLNEWYSRRHSRSYMVLPPILSRAGLRIRDDSGEVFCDTRCEQEHEAKRAAVDHAHAEAEREAERRWPGCPSYESKRWPYMSPYVNFTPPGMKWPAGWRPGEEPHFAEDDRSAWETFVSKLPKEEHGEAQAEIA